MLHFAFEDKVPPNDKKGAVREKSGKDGLLKIWDQIEKMPVYGFCSFFSTGLSLPELSQLLLYPSLEATFSKCFGF